jgi:excinuclease UvrABC ATPase subunit
MALIKRISTNNTVCPNCKGRGKVYIENRVDAYSSERKIAECPYCEGKRVVEERVELHTID